MNKKGVEMSLNTIIVMVIVLLILLIMAFVLTGGFQNLTKGTDCKSKGFSCENKCEDPNPVPLGWSCQEKGTVCCGPPLITN